MAARLTLWEKFRRDLVHELLIPPQCSTQSQPDETPDDDNAKAPESSIKLVCISDTHNGTPPVADGDVLLHAGDLSNNGTLPEIQRQLDWLASLPHAHKVVIAGNHELLLDRGYPHSRAGIDPTDRRELNWHDITYLEDAATTLTVPRVGRSITVYGSPRTPAYGPWAFQYLRTEADATWRDRIPEHTDVLLCHGPPLGTQDAGKGCAHLLREIRRARPRLVVCGHIHEGRGRGTIYHDDWVANMREDVVRRTLERVIPGILEVLAVILLIVFTRLWDRVRFRRRKPRLSPQLGTTLVINAASAGSRGHPPRMDMEGQRAGMVVYL